MSNRRFRKPGLVLSPALSVLGSGPLLFGSDGAVNLVELGLTPTDDDEDNDLANAKSRPLSPPALGLHRTARPSAVRVDSVDVISRKRRSFTRTHSGVPQSAAFLDRRSRFLPLFAGTVLGLGVLALIVVLFLIVAQGGAPQQRTSSRGGRAWGTHVLRGGGDRLRRATVPHKKIAEKKMAYSLDGITAQADAAVAAAAAEVGQAEAGQEEATRPPLHGAFKAHLDPISTAAIELIGPPPDDNDDDNHDEE